MSSRRACVLSGVAAVVACVWGGVVWGQLARPAVVGAGGRVMTFPYTVPDAAGNQWMVFGNGTVQQQGAQPVFQQAGMLTVNGASAPMMRAGVAARLDEKTGEVTIENLSMGGMAVTRRVLVSKEEGTVRFVDTFRNTGGRDASVTVNYTSNFNFGLAGGRLVADPRRKDGVLGWAGATGNNRGVYVVMALPGSKLSPRINVPEGGSVVQGAFTLTVPAGKEQSLVVWLGSAEGVDKAEAVVTGVKPGKLLSGLAGDVRRTLANMATRTGLPGDLELLRGELFDVVETRTGDQLRGTIKDAGFALTTAFGRLELPGEKVAGLFVVGGQRPVMLVVTREGEVFGGTPEKEVLTLELTSGQVVRVPVGQVTRAGFRQRTGESEDGEVTGPGKPEVVLRSGQRMAIAGLPGALSVATRYGVLALPPASVASVVMRGEDSPVHVVTLTDGSRLSGLLTATSLDLTLDGAAGPAKLTVPTAAISRLSPVAPRGAEEAGGESDVPELRCAGEDVLRGVLAGDFEVETAFETVRVKGEQVRRISRPESSGSAGEGGGVAVTLWDDSVVVGRPTKAGLEVRLGSGVEVLVPFELIEGYGNPRPAPSDEMGRRVRALVAQLNDDDFKVREAAQLQLLASGRSIVPVLKEVRGSQPIEAQQRIDAIVGQLEK